MSFIFQMKFTKYTYIFLVILLLSIGLIIYYYGRKIYFFEIINIEQTKFPLKGTVVLNYVPDFLWSLSLAIITKVYSHKKVIFFTSLIFAIILELIQVFTSIFTFDVFDILVISTAFLVVYVLTYNK